MAFISQSIKNLLAGVSQQPATLRYPEQLEHQENGLSTGPAGLQKRPPTLHVAALDASTIVSGVKPLVHLIERDASERYVVMFNGEGIAVWDLNGNRKTVNYAAGTQAYLASANPREELKAVTVADYTFITNTAVEAAMSEEVVTDVWAAQGALVHVKSGQYGRTYQIIINGAAVSSYITPDGSDPTHTAAIDTNHIASALGSYLNASYEVAQSGEGWLYIRPKTGTPAITSVETKDGFNNQAMFGFLQDTQKFSNLPSTAPNGFTVRVQGETGSSADDYYVKYDASNKVWKETAKPGILKSFDASTMPHVLVREADGAFTFREAEWDGREVGDDDSNPLPSFIGRKITDVLFIRNRLGFLAGENVILSKSGEFFKFWTSTATDVVDTDMIDDAVPDESVTTLHYGVPFNEELLLFSARGQYIGKSDTVFTPKSFRIDRTTRFDCNPHCRPVQAGRRVYFANSRAEYSSLLEYYIVQDVTEVKDAQDVSSHVPSFIPNTVHKILGSTSENLLLSLSTGDESRIYTYKYLFNEATRVQASWSFWEMGDAAILGGGFVGSTLYLLLTRGSGLYLEKMLFTQNTKDNDVEPYRAHMDRKAVTAPLTTYNILTDSTTVDVQGLYGGGSLPASATYQVVHPDGMVSRCAASAMTGGTMQIPGDLTGQRVVVGEVTNFKVVLSEIMIKNEDGKGGVKARNRGKLQVKSVTLHYDKSGYFKVSVAHAGKQTFVYEMTARLLGSTKNVLGALPLDTGSITVPVQGDSQDVTLTIESDWPAPLALIGFDWEGTYTERSTPR
ncbi:hypothetical protein [Anaeroselena agilis]|uniref:Tail tubular protein B n=1 Tax=Anaeroselena agilis TaxID=3063788 RepID=A0ABU3NWM7_9FIRM|nr:hypothetical protein [Selenomonadales bacterium 4137-cl]